MSEKDANWALALKKASILYSIFWQVRKCFDSSQFSPSYFKSKVQTTHIQKDTKDTSLYHKMQPRRGQKDF